MQFLTYLHNFKYNVCIRHRPEIPEFQIAAKPLPIVAWLVYTIDGLSELNQRPIQRYHRRSHITYCLATVHNVTDDRQTENRAHDLNTVG